MTEINRDPAGSGSGRGGSERRLLIALIAVVVVAAAAITVAVLQTVRTNRGASLPSSSPFPTASSGSSSPSPTASFGSSSSASTPPFTLGYQPLYPFADLASAQGWQSNYRSGGTDAWHLDGGKTALAFTQQFLGFTQVNTVTSTNTDSIGMHVGVGFPTPNATLLTAAVLHLVRYGAQSDSPWEVVGSDDTTFSLDTPTYGAHVTSPITTGGRITGVDESITVTVRQIGASATLGQSCCTPAGGDNQPWAATVAYTGSAGRVLTIVAVTGGHLQQVERFAITAAIG